MTHINTYTESNWSNQEDICKTYQLKTGNVVRLLVKKDGKPYKFIRFINPSGRMMKASENDNS